MTFLYLLAAVVIVFFLVPRKYRYFTSRQSDKNAKGLGVLGIVCGFLSASFPLLFGLGGIILGILTIRKGERVIGILALVFTLFVALSAIFVSYAAYSQGDTISLFSVFFGPSVLGQIMVGIGS